jgi:hypothetical protein
MPSSKTSNDVQNFVMNSQEFKNLNACINPPLYFRVVGEGGCTNDTNAVRNTCQSTGAEIAGQQSNGCWHCLVTKSGNIPPTNYKNTIGIPNTNKSKTTSTYAVEPYEK